MHRFTNDIIGNAVDGAAPDVLSKREAPNAPVVDEQVLRSMSTRFLGLFAAIMALAKQPVGGNPKTTPEKMFGHNGMDHSRGNHGKDGIQARDRAMAIKARNVGHKKERKGFGN